MVHLATLKIHFSTLWLRNVLVSAWIVYLRIHDSNYYYYYYHYKYWRKKYTRR